MEEQKTRIVGPIEDYLRGKERRMDPTLLQNACDALIHAIERQLMTERDTDRGEKRFRLSTGLYCPKRVAYDFHQVEGSGFEPRTIIKFLSGDIHEVAVITLASLAGLPIGMSQLEVEVEFDGIKVIGHLDALLEDDDGLWAVEVKSVTQQGLKEFESDPVGWAKKWDYYGQGQRYAYAADAQGVIFLLICRDTGHIAEHTFLLDEEDIERSRQIWKMVYNSESPDDIERAFETEPERENVQGKAKIPHDKIDVAVRNGSWYSWETGREILSVRCGYCNFNELCWPGAQLETKSGKPVWIVGQIEV